jgi:predicted PurR-regulated permease PerM
MAIPDLTIRKIVAGVLVILSVLAMFMFVYYFRNEVVLVFAAIVISISMAPAVDWMRRHKLSPSLSVILIYVCLAIFFFGFIFLIVPQIMQQVNTLFPRLEGVYVAFKSSLQSSPYPYVGQWASYLPANLSSIFISSSSATGAGGANSVNLTLNLAQNLISGLFTFIVVILIGFYWTLEGERVKYTFLLFLAEEKREGTREAICDIETRVGGFVRGQGLLALAIGVMALVAYLIIGLPSALSLAFLAGMFELVPVFGPTLGALPALLVAFTSSPSLVVWVILAMVLIQVLENNLLAPRVMQKTVGVNPIIVILSLTGFGFLFGFSGLLMAIPLAAIIQVVIDRSLFRPAEAEVKPPMGRDSLSKLSYEVHEFVQDVRKRVRRKEPGTLIENGDEVEDAIEAIANDLDGLLAQTIEPDKDL